VLGLFGLEQWLTTFVSLEITTVGLMLTATSVLIREYLSESRRLAVNSRVNLYFALISSLIAVPIVLICANAVIVLTADIPLSAKTVMTLFVVSPLFPIGIVLAILWKVDSE
jgi:hypothetical protein